jgi:hypothetical protein
VATIIELSSQAQAQAAAAREWRKACGMTVHTLSIISGYSETQIRVYERGYNNNGTKINDATWQRYRLACAAINAILGGWQWQYNEEVSDHG